MSKLTSIPTTEGQDALWINIEHVVAVRHHVFNEDEDQNVPDGEEPALGEFVIGVSDVGGGEDASFPVAYYDEAQRDGILSALGLAA